MLPLCCSNAFLLLLPVLLPFMLVNDCLAASNNCSLHAQCVNLIQPGDFICHCMPGYMDVGTAEQPGRFCLNESVAEPPFPIDNSLFAGEFSQDEEPTLVLERFSQDEESHLLEGFSRDGESLVLLKGKKGVGAGLACCGASCGVHCGMVLVFG